MYAVGKSFKNVSITVLHLHIYIYKLKRFLCL